MWTILQEDIRVVEMKRISGTEVRITQKMKKERQNSYQKNKRVSGGKAKGQFPFTSAALFIFW